MFTGIIKATGQITKIISEGTNRHFTIRSGISSELNIDQSVSHNGVCLTVVDQQEDYHVVTAIEETLTRSALGTWKVGKIINLELSMQLNDRIDGHLVQGHVDAIGNCRSKESRDGSYLFTFEYPEAFAHLLVPKGSICVDGVSLTVINPTKDHFTVAIIPYTLEETDFKFIEPGDPVNLEFDIIGKYLQRRLELVT